jgi:hypothetical protein
MTDHHSLNPPKYGVETRLIGDHLIEQTIDLAGEITRRVLNAAEQQVIDHLAKLGWSPPAKFTQDRPRITREEFATLPENVRRYIHMIETDCDPSGTIRSEMHLRDQVQALELRVQELQDPASERARAIYREGWTDGCIRGVHRAGGDLDELDPGADAEEADREADWLRSDSKRAHG